MGFVGKGQRQRSVALPCQALEIVRHYLASRNGDGHHPEAPLIRKEDGSGEALSYYVINRVVTRWTRRHLGVRLTPHKLRHAYGKHCVDQGVDIRVIAEAPGHESLESTKIYTQVPSSAPARSPSYLASPGLNYSGAILSRNSASSRTSKLPEGVGRRSTRRIVGLRRYAN